MGVRPMPSGGDGKSSGHRRPARLQPASLHSLAYVQTLKRRPHASGCSQVITWWTVSSCTSDKSVAQNFMKQLGGTATLLTLDTTRCV